MVKHNGWSNYKTWRAVVEIDNTEYLYTRWHRAAKEMTAADLTKQLAAHYPDKDINHREIAEHLQDPENF